MKTGDNEDGNGEMNEMNRLLSAMLELEVAGSKALVTPAATEEAATEEAKRGACALFS